MPPTSPHQREPLSNRKHETWYIAESSSLRHKGVLYIGVILMAPDMRRSVELNPNPPKEGVGLAS